MDIVLTGASQAYIPWLIAFCSKKFKIPTAQPTMVINVPRSANKFYTVVKPTAAASENMMGKEETQSALRNSVCTGKWNKNELKLQCWVFHG